MNPFYDPEIFKKAIYPRWYRIWLWIFPTYVSFSEMAIFYKKVGKKIYIVGMEHYPDISKTIEREMHRKLNQEDK